MSRTRLPLYAQFLGWSVLNLMLLAGLLFAFAGGSGGRGLEMLLTETARERAQGLGFALSRQLDAVPEDGWPEVVAAFADNYGVDLTLERQQRVRPFEDSRFRNEPFGWSPPGGFEPAPMLPEPAHAEFGRSGRFGGGPPRFPTPMPDGSFVRIRRAENGYEVRIPMPVVARTLDERRALIVHTPTLWPLLRFLGMSEWILLLIGALALCALWWWPFFYGITRRVGRLTRITERIAEGRLSERALPGRPDELGRLAQSVNRMGVQLQAKAEGQRQFLLDVAHELTSPLARMQLGLAIAQDELPEEDARRLTPVLGDAQQMSELLQDLLQYSREDGRRDPASVAPVMLAALILEVRAQEAAQAIVTVDAPADLQALADRALLARALANLVRNAVRHGRGSAVEVKAQLRAPQVEITVADRGPGVPDSALAHLGEPFYRPDVARDRDTGGVGLGLAIVRRCVERCGGQVRFANRQGGGFEARVELPPAPGGAAAASAGGASPRE